MSAFSVPTLRRRFAQTCAIGLMFVGLAVVLMVLQVIPVRAYVLQRDDLKATSGRLAMVSARNSELEARVQLLHTDGEMARLALDQFGMVRRGDQLTVITGLPGSESRLGSARTDATEGPMPAATASRRVSRWRALLDAVQFWR